MKRERFNSIAHHAHEGLLPLDCNRSTKRDCGDQGSHE